MVQLQFKRLVWILSIFLLRLLSRILLYLLASCLVDVYNLRHLSLILRIRHLHFSLDLRVRYLHLCLNLGIRHLHLSINLVLGHLYVSWLTKLRLRYSTHSILLNILWLVWLHHLDLSHLNRLRHWLSLLIHMLVTLLVDGLVISFAWKRYFNLHVTFSLLRNCSFNPRIRSVNLYRSLLPFLISHLLCYELLLRYLISLLSTIKG